MDAGNEPAQPTLHRRRLKMKSALIAVVLATGVMLGGSAPVFAQYTFGAPSVGAGQAGGTNAPPSQGR